jgi:hypothetical protein
VGQATVGLGDPDGGPTVEAGHKDIVFPGSYTTDYVVSDGVLAPGATGVVIATCPTESTVVGGGFKTHEDVVVISQYKAGNGWLGDAWNTGAESRVFSSYAVCLFEAPHASTSIVYGEVEIAGGENGRAVATCPSGTIVTGGGFNAYPTGDLLPYVSSRTETGEAWYSWAKNLTRSTRTHQAFAVCLSGTGGSTRSVLSLPVWLSPGASSGVKPECGYGEVVTSGGYGSNDEINVYSSWGPRSMVQIVQNEWWIDAVSTSSTTDRYFWGTVTCATLGIFADGFESGDTTQWSVSVP